MSLFSPVQLACGLTLKNPCVLAPLTNQQSLKDGTLSPSESTWLIRRAQGGFGLIVTAATFVLPNGKGFEGQFGMLPTLDATPHQHMNAEIHRLGAVSIAQLYHGGSRSLATVEGGPVSPSGSSNSSVLSLDEVKQLQEAFVNAAILAKEWGYDGVQLHAAHGYLLSEFLSPTLNQRQDQYGGSRENRVRLLVDIVTEIREKLGPEFLLSVRLSPERFGMELEDALEIGQILLNLGMLDILDWSLWDVQAVLAGRTLTEWVLDLEYSTCKSAVAGKIASYELVNELFIQGVDCVSIGRGAILHPNFPEECAPGFQVRALPVTAEYLEAQGLSQPFIEYLRRWDGFVG